MSDFLLSLKDVSLAFGGPSILDRVSISIHKGLRAALTGRNGEGKSTLMKVIAGTLEPDSGEIIRAPGIRIEYVTQDGQARTEDERGLSGGQIRRRRLEAALLAKPDILLLDEPTNHLDIETIDWLEGMIRRLRETAVIVVTHDRRFLRRVANRIFDLDRGELSGWECDYSTFVKRKADLLADEAVYWERKSKKLAQEEAWIRRGVKARTTRNEGRVAALLKLREEFANRRLQSNVSTLRLDTAAPGGDLVLKIKELSFAYGDKTIIRGFTGNILRGERIGILGRNGCGKTTLINLLTHRLAPDSGSVVLGTNVEMSFLDQLRGDLDDELTVGENIAADRDEVIVGGVKKHVYSYLADFLFPPERVRTPVKALSGGEKARLMLAKLFLTPSNLLILDEPTNDLDIETLELLEEQLLNYRGTLLLVSHDREFLDNVVTSTLVLEGDGEVRSYPGGYADYLRQRPTAVTEEKAVSTPRPKPTSDTKKLSYREQRELQSLPAEIEELETKISTILASDPVQNRVAFASIPELQKTLDALFNRWAELEERQQA